MRVPVAVCVAVAVRVAVRVAAEVPVPGRAVRVKVLLLEEVFETPLEADAVRVRGELREPLALAEALRVRVGVFEAVELPVLDTVGGALRVVLALRDEVFVAASLRKSSMLILAKKK